MPSGKVHTSITLALTSIEFLLLPFYPDPNNYFLAIGTFSGIFITPDHDIDAGNISFSLVRERLGDLPSLVWRTFWFPYAKMVSHRSVLSHGPVIGTVLRIVYLFLILSLLLVMFLAFFFFTGAVAAKDTGSIFALYFEYARWVFIGPEFYYWFIGLSIADIAHFLADNFSN